MTGRDPALVEALRRGSLARRDRCGSCGRCGDCGAFAAEMGELKSDPDGKPGSLYGRTTARGLDPDLKGLVGKPYAPPRLKRDGQPFKPTPAAKDVPVGSMVAWTEWTTEHGGADSKRVEVTRRGQVWAGCPKAPGAVWVAPEDGGSAVALSKTLDVLP